MAEDFRCQVKQIISDFKAAERITGDISVGIVAVAVALWAVLLAGTMALQAELFYFAAKKIGIGRVIVAATSVAGETILLCRIEDQNRTRHRSGNCRCRRAILLAGTMALQ